MALGYLQLMIELYEVLHVERIRLRGEREAIQMKVVIR